MASVNRLMRFVAIGSLIGASTAALAAKPTQAATPKGNGGGGMSGPVLAALKAGLSGPAVAFIASKGRSKASPD